MSDFVSNESRVLLLCNGDYPSRAIAQELANRAQFVLCADGGANVARRLAVLPDLILGDFDSMSTDTKEFYRTSGTEMLYLERQNDTDFEKALLLLLEKGMCNVDLLGVTGGLLDHTFGNMSIILRYVRNFDFVLYDPHYRVDIILNSTIFPSKRGDRVSVVPLRASTGVRYEGLRYTLHGETLEIGRLEGTCNEAVAEEFTVHVDDGVLLVFRPLRMELLDARGRDLLCE